MTERYLGLCAECNEKIEYIPQGGVFKGGESLTSLFSVCYYTGNIRSAIKQYKFYGQSRYSKIFVEMMYKYLKNLNLHKEFDLVTMIPLSRKRLRERGYNQTELLAKPLAEKLGIEFNGSCVFKKRNNKVQSYAKSAAERRLNVKDAYIADFSKIKGKNILLIDDVYTTGSTMQECARELKSKGAENVLGITLAKTDRRV